MRPTPDVITASAGTYNENLVIDKSLTLRGPNSLLTPCVDTRVAEAVITGGLSISNGSDKTVLVEGFHFQGVSSPLSYNGNSGTATLTGTFRKNLVNMSSGQLADIYWKRYQHRCLERCGQLFPEHERQCHANRRWRWWR